MKHYIGIDLGTTNSAIASFDGKETRIWKSPEQNDVTPSVILFDRRGNKYIGKRAYDAAPNKPDNVARLFKRLMGTSTPISLSEVKITKTPEQCSAEVLKALYGYLAEEIRDVEETGTVITVPAAFNQMQRDATMQAADLAGIGKIALMQEPVAAVMSVMRVGKNKADGIFAIYDLGGGTLDVAIAESLSGRVNLLEHGGIAMCGGRDWDRVLIDNVVKPWLLEKFNLPEDLTINPDYKVLIRLAEWAAERAKIELSSSSKDDITINLSEDDAKVKDKDNQEVYLDIPLARETLDRLILDRIDESIECVRTTLNKAGIQAHDVTRIAFVGGPTNYKPLRDKVSFELGIESNFDVNPMTAVAEGAALFAESIDWSSQSRKRKSSRGKISSSRKQNFVFNYVARTPEPKAKIVVQMSDESYEGAEFQVDSMETGWTSGRFPLSDKSSVDVMLEKRGENAFKVFVFDSGGRSIKQDKIIITRIATTVDAIPASHSIGIAVLETMGGQPILEWFVRAGDQLPQEGILIFKTIESLKAGSPRSINFKIWEGEIETPIADNRFVGMLKVSGSDFDEGVIPAGADLNCDYKVLDSGQIVLEISVPSIGATFACNLNNFYSRQDGQIDFTNASERIVEESKSTMERLNQISAIVENPKLEKVRKKLTSASNVNPNDPDTERAQEAMEEVLDAKRLLAQVRKEHLKEFRQQDLDSIREFFEGEIRKDARPNEETAFDNLVRTAQRDIDRNGKDFENHHDQLKRKIFGFLIRQDSFIVSCFKHMAQSPHNFADQERYSELIKAGKQFLKSDDIDSLRGVIGELENLRITTSSEMEILEETNIVRG